MSIYKTLNADQETWEALNTINMLTAIPKVQIVRSIVLRELASIKLITSRCTCDEVLKMPHGEHAVGCPNRVTV